MSTTSYGRTRALRAAALGGAVAVGTMVVAATGSPASAAGAAEGEIYVVHALAGPAADLAVDGEVVDDAAAPKTVIGPIKLAVGTHEVSFGAVGQTPVTASFDLAAGQSMDVVAHQGADSGSGTVLTVFPNDLSPITPDKARLVVAHTAVVPPADVRVDGAVLFSNVANGEALTLVVPGGTYDVDIVPASTSGPVVFGPVALTVVAEQLNRVYAFGSPDETGMDAIVRTSDLLVVGAGEPGSVETGTGGQAAVAADRSAPARVLPGAVGLALAGILTLGGIGALRSGRRGRAVS